MKEKEKEKENDDPDELLYNKKYYSGGSSISCYYHPKEAVIGVCHLCLNERLLILAATASSSLNNNNNHTFTTNHTQKHNQKQSNLLFPCSNNSTKSTKLPYINISLPYIFALFTPTTTQRRRTRHRNRNSDHDFYDAADYDHHHHQDSTSTSLEDESFISIKFGDNGIASWDKKSSGCGTTTLSKMPMPMPDWGTASQTSLKNVTCSNNSSSRRTVVEHAKPRPLRWRKRIGQLLQLIRWKKFSKVS